MSAIPAASATAPAAAPAGEPWSDSVLVAISLILLVLAAFLLAIEFFVVSFGLLALLAAGAALAGIIVGFAVSEAWGWTLIGLSCAGTVLTVRWGLARLRASAGAVPKAEITDDAGVHHEAERLGLAVGTTGELVTDAFPTGRARFGAGREVDVEVEGRVCRKGERVRVLRIVGPAVTVAPADPPSPPPTKP